MKLQGLTPERPLTHDLFATDARRARGHGRAGRDPDLADETYHARLCSVGGDDRHEIDARPSDALALAVRPGVRIFATAEVLDRAARRRTTTTTTRTRARDEATAGGPPLEETGRADRPDRASTIFREFVNSLDPDQRAAGRRLVLELGPAARPSEGVRRSGAQDRAAAAERALAVRPHPQAQPPEVLHGARR